MSIFIEPDFTSDYKRCPLALVDVGASGGLESNWAAATEHLRVIAFDADERAFGGAKTDDGRRIVLNVGLHNQKGSLVFYQTRKERVSSIFRPNRDFLNRFNCPERFDVLETKTISVDTLDNQLREHEIANVDFIKVDTQGSELFVLQGAIEILRSKAFGVEVEVEFAEMYENQPLFADVDKFLRAIGFQLLDLKLCHMKRAAGKQWGYRKGQLIYGDALYLKDFRGLGMILQGLPETEQGGKVLRALSICFLYGYFDFALEIFEHEQHLFDDKQSAAILNRIKSTRSLSSRIPMFRGRQRLANVLARLSEVVKPTKASGTTSQKHLGNL